MKPTLSVLLYWLMIIGGGSFCLTGCNLGERLERIGREPPLTPIDNPQHTKGYRMVQMPMPHSLEPEIVGPNSLWRQGRKSFFKDQRASHVGDILTIEVRLNDYAKFNNQTSRSRTASEGAGIPQFLGTENWIAKHQLNASNLVSMNSSTASAGNGKIDRKEDVNINIAAVVTQILPNGNLVIMGRQELRVNYELRQLQVAGIVRPEDINPAKNSVGLEKIAEARISYGGKGHLSDYQQERYGKQILDVLLPF